MAIFHKLNKLIETCNSPEVYRLYTDKCLEAVMMMGGAKDDEHKWAPLRWEFFHRYASTLYNMYENTQHVPTSNDAKVHSKTLQRTNRNQSFFEQMRPFRETPWPWTTWRKRQSGFEQLSI